MLGLSLSMASMPVFGMSAVQRAISILRRISNTTDLHLTSVVGTTATSAGPVTIADGGYVEVLSGKTWSIV